MGVRGGRARAPDPDCTRATCTCWPLPLTAAADHGASDVRPLLRAAREGILAGVVVLFSRVLPRDCPQPSAHPLWQLATKVCARAGPRGTAAALCGSTASPSSPTGGSGLQYVFSAVQEGCSPQCRPPAGTASPPHLNPPALPPRPAHAAGRQVRARRGRVCDPRRGP